MQFQVYQSLWGAASGDLESLLSAALEGVYQRAGAEAIRIGGG